MARIEITKTPSGESVYAVDGERRALLGFIAKGNEFRSVRPECERFHRQRWGESLMRSIQDAWLGKGIPNG